MVNPLSLFYQYYFIPVERFLLYCGQKRRGIDFGLYLSRDDLNCEEGLYFFLSMLRACRGSSWATACTWPSNARFPPSRPGPTPRRTA